MRVPRKEVNGALDDAAWAEAEAVGTAEIVKKEGENDDREEEEELEELEEGVHSVCRLAEIARVVRGEVRPEAGRRFIRVVLDDLWAAWWWIGWWGVVDGDCGFEPRSRGPSELLVQLRLLLPASIFPNNMFILHCQRGAHVDLVDGVCQICQSPGFCFSLVFESLFFLLLLEGLGPYFGCCFHFLLSEDATGVLIMDARHAIVFSLDVTL